MKSGLVSVIIPCYNMSCYISDAISSVRNQSYRDIEIIVVDDGSEDGIDETLNSLSDKNLKVIKQKNQGLAAARNTGLVNSQGEFIQFLDADDVLFPEKIKKQVDFLNSNSEYGIVTCNCLEVSEDLIKMLKEKIPPIAIEVSHNMILKTNIMGVVHGPLVKRTIIDEYGLFDLSFGNYCADWAFWAKPILNGEKVGYLDEDLCYYRRHSKSLTKKEVYPNTVGDLKVVESIYKNIIQSNIPKSVIVKELGRKHKQSAIWAFREGQFSKFLYHLYKNLRFDFNPRNILAILYYSLNHRKN